MATEVPVREQAADVRDAVRERVAARAYEIYVERGAADGFAFEDWLRAEAEVLGHEAAA